MPLSKPTRWSLIAITAVLALIFGPLALIMAGDFGAGLLVEALNRRPTSDELVGSYKLDAPWGSSTLQINADGTFRQEIDEQGHPGRSVSGHWQASQEFNSLAVDFHRFSMVWDDDHERDTNIYRINFYRPHFGVTYGMIDDDLGEKFIKLQGGDHGNH